MKQPPALTPWAEAFASLLRIPRRTLAEDFDHVIAQRRKIMPKTSARTTGKFTPWGEAFISVRKETMSKTGTKTTGTEDKAETGEPAVIAKDKPKKKTNSKHHQTAIKPAKSVLKNLFSDLPVFDIRVHQNAAEDGAGFFVIRVPNANAAVPEGHWLREGNVREKWLTIAQDRSLKEAVRRAKKVWTRVVSKLRIEPHGDGVWWQCRLCRLRCHSAVLVADADGLCPFCTDQEKEPTS